MITYILILAHLTTDFLFQPSRLVAWKEKSWVGTLVHVLILEAVCMALLFPYLSQITVFAAIDILAVTHFTQDWLKTWYDRKYNTSKLSYPFFVDQFFHLLIIYFIGGYLDTHLATPLVSRIYLNEDIYIGFSLLILFSYALDIANYQVKRHKNPSLPYVRRYDFISKGILAFAVFYAIFLIATRF